jgi:diguanylate cyclase (GGDEF)-like protein
VDGIMALEHHEMGPRWHRRADRVPGSALALYASRLGQLVERDAAESALLAARDKAEHEAAEANRARAETESVLAALREEMVSHQRAQSRLAFLACHDPLTTLPNRTWFSDRLGREMEEARRYRRRLALLYIDLDNFKDVNDTLGHAAGDALLKQVAARIEEALRVGQSAARLGGDEFAVLHIDPKSAEEAGDVAERLIQSLAKSFDIDHRSIFVSASIGITLFPDDADAVEPLQRNADVAMYKAKSEGRNRCRFFDEALEREVHHRAFLEQALREPAMLSQLEVVFQPQVHVRSRRLTGVEALLRWDHPVQGILHPAEFVAISERCGAIADIGRWVLHESCRHGATWLRANLPPLTVSVNVSPAQFRMDDIPEVVAQVLADTGLPPPLLELEITESMQDMHEAVQTLEALHRLGVGIAIDDFGTGYSSLSYLRRLPVDRLKIDRSFVQDVTSNEEAATVVKAIVQLAHNLHLKVVAEGVETEAHEDFVRKVGCTYAQGFFYSKPLDAAELESLMLRQPEYELVQ